MSTRFFSSWGIKWLLKKKKNRWLGWHYFTYVSYLWCTKRFTVKWKSSVVASFSELVVFSVQQHQQAAVIYQQAAALARQNSLSGNNGLHPAAPQPFQAAAVVSPSVVASASMFSKEWKFKHDIYCITKDSNGLKLGVDKILPFCSLPVSCSLSAASSSFF